jgi:hypothetical protein
MNQEFLSQVYAILANSGPGGGRFAPAEDIPPQPQTISPGIIVLIAVAVAIAIGLAAYFCREKHLDKLDKQLSQKLLIPLENEATLKHKQLESMSEISRSSKTMQNQASNKNQE